MSSYYHKFVPGFNFWYVVAPILLVMAAHLGTLTVRMDKDLVIWKKKQKVCQRRFVALAIVAGVIIFVMTVLESGQGVLQFFDNTLTVGESPIYSLILASGALGCFALIYGGAVYIAGWLGRKIKIEYLHAEKECILERRYTKQNRVQTSR